jgi:hypothetical protein
MTFEQAVAYALDVDRASPAQAPGNWPKRISAQ